MPGVVTQYLFDLIAKQVADHRLVVWYDPEGVYAGAVDELRLPDVTVSKYDGSFVQLRRTVDDLLSIGMDLRLFRFGPARNGCDDEWSSLD